MGMTFGKRLAYTRKKKELTQKQLAKLVGVCLYNIQRLELDRQTPNAAMIQKITTALEVPADWFENNEYFSMAERNLKALGKRLAYTRKKKGLSQKQLAKLAGVCQDSIYRMELDKQTPNAAMIQKITTALEVPADWFENEDNFSMAEVNLKAFGQHLVYTRKKKGLSQKQLAKLTGVSHESINRIETGRQNPRAALIQKITTALEVPADWFENEDNFSAENQQDSDLTREQRRTLAKRLGYVRKRKGLQQKELADLIGVKCTWISNWETCHSTPSVDMIQKIATALEVSMEWLENDDNFSAVNQQSHELTKERRRTLAKRLGYVRKQKGLQQKELADLIGVTHATYGNWETGWSVPSAATIHKIAAALEVSMEWLENDDNFMMENIIDIRDRHKLTKEQQQLVLDNEYIIYCVLKKYNLTHLQDELWDIGLIGLCKAALRWDEKKDVSFFTVAFNYIKWELNTEGRKEMKLLRSQISLDQPVNDDDSDTLGSIISDIDDEFEQLEYKILVESVYQKVEYVLTPKEKVAFKHWLHGEDYIEIAKSMGGITFQTVSEHIVNAKNKCKTHFRSDEMFA